MHQTLQPLGEHVEALRAAFELVQQPVFVVQSDDHQIVDANAAACQALAMAREHLIGRLWPHVASRFPTIELRRVSIDGRIYVAVGPPSLSAQREPPASPRDALTGLAGRDALAARLSDDGARLRRLALLFIDLDGFKRVNDHWGHVTGDRVLKSIAQRMNESVRPGDLVVRYGGDEFLVVVRDVSRQRDLERLARRIARGVRQPVVVEGREFVLSASIGIARRTSPEQSIEALVAEADRAMYRAKSQYRAAIAGRRLPEYRQDAHVSADRVSLEAS